MPITQVGTMTFSTQQDFFTIPTTIARPTGVVQGDLVVVLFRHNNQGGDPTMTDGFTRLIFSSPVAVWYKMMGASELSTWNISHAQDTRGAAAVAFRGVSQLSPVDASAFTASAGTFPGVISTRSGVQLALAANGGSGETGMGYPSGYTGAGASTAAQLSNASLAAAFVVRAIGTHPGGSFTGAGAAFGASLFLADANAAPNASPLTYPVGNVTIDRNLLLRSTWNFSDPDPGDTQSKYDIQYRLVGAGSWTGPFTGVTANGFHDFAAGTFAAGAYEWQVRTYDSLGAVGPYSASGFFTAGSPPAGPTITAPTNGATLNTATTTLTWSSPTQDAYRVRKVADAAGAADTATVYFDTGIVEQANVRSHQLTFATNSRFEHLQVLVRTSGLWSAWGSTRILVSFTPPATPTITVAVNTAAGALTVTAVHPTPTGGQPTVTSLDVHRRLVGEAGDGIRVAAGRTPTGSFIDHTVASGVSYEYRVRAHGTTGASSLSVWSESFASAPLITTQPSDVTVTPGQTATFVVAASGAALIYQWQHNGLGSFLNAGEASATTAVLTTGVVGTEANSRRYQVVVTNPNGTVTSRAATLSIVATAGSNVFPLTFTATL